MSGSAHLFRFSLATHLVNHGTPIKEIADMLGHASIDTTAIYTKVDVTHLADESFWEAVQLVFLFHTIFQLDERYAMALGRLDQYLFPFYQAAV